jgi:eukaryotic-like serine/threonine-protein kinase
VTESSRTPEQNAAIDRAFEIALDLRGHRRVEYVADLRRRDEALATAVERLLAATERPDPRLDPDAWAGRRIWTPADLPPDPAREHDRVGPYRVLREIGRGGMSVVYLARRDDGQFDRYVALKFLGVHHALGVRRFERERRILAGLTHPNIARLLDGGSDDAGRPYIVMEYVEGRPLDLFCNETGADLDRRLELIGVVADAVEYAHRNLVVHRDLKPSNILVTADGQVKLLDFGIAKLISPAEPDPAEPATRTLLRVLTPEYASPEQVRGERITTATDVYQLGVLLYELMTGTRPYERVGDGFGELERSICEGMAPLPSAVAGRRDELVDGPGHPMTRRRRLRGDLDAITLKAMALHPERRYATVGELRDDIGRFRSGAPVRARTPTPWYRGAKFVRRHRTGVAMAVLLAALVAGYIATMTVHSRRVMAEAAKTQQVKDILASLFTAANPGVSHGREPMASDLLEAGARRVAELEGQPEVQAELMALLGEVYGTLGRYPEAGALLEPALEMRRRHLGPGDPELARTAQLLGTIRHFEGHLTEAEDLLREALEIRRGSLGEHHGLVGTTLEELGDLLHTRGELAEAEEVLKRALDIQRHAGYFAVAAERHLANVYRDRGASAAAEALYRRSLRATEARFGIVDPIASLTRSELALLLTETGRLAEADSLLDANFRIYEVLYPGGHAMVGTTYRNRGVLRLRQGRTGEALALLDSAMSVYSRTLGEESSMTARALRFRAEALLLGGEPAAAARVAADAVQRLSRRGLPGHPAVADALEVQALARLQQGRAPEAAALLTEVLERRRRLSVTDDPRLAITRARLRGANASARAVVLGGH